jgi:PTH1 family peptidyl-tRNA hydrolase
MWMIVGLGNPGSKYAFNRHNVGFMLTDVLAHNLSQEKWQTDKKAHTLKVQWHKEQCLLVKPQTYMNKSGEIVISLMQFYKIPIENIVVVQDDIDQSFANIKLQKNRGHGGHNGIRNISELLNTSDYIRLKIGVGRPSIPQMDVADWVLQNFGGEEMALMPQILQKGCEAIESLILDGFPKASSIYNGAINKQK